MAKIRDRTEDFKDAINRGALSFGFNEHIPLRPVFLFIFQYKFGGDVGDDGSDSYGSGDGVPDYLVWDTRSFVSLDDLIVSSGSNHDYQAMGVPPLPKNRNAAFGTYKDELLHQLRELPKSVPNLGDNQGTVKEHMVTDTTQNIQLEAKNSGFVHKSEQNMYSSYEYLQDNMFQWCFDSGDIGGQEFYSSQLVEHDVESNCLVPDEKLDIVYRSSHTNASHEGESHNTAIVTATTTVVETAQVFPAVGACEINSQERETALSCYKEKKKSRRYDKHIRYESRKVRAESRIRRRCGSMCW